MSLKVVQLVILEFLPRDFEQEREVMMACQANDDTLLEEQLSQPRNPILKMQMARRLCM